MWLLHLPTAPLYFFHNIQATVDNELIHMPCLLREFGNPVTTLFRGPKLMLEERIVLRANYGKVERHYRSGEAWGSLSGRLKLKKADAADWLRILDLR